MTLAPVSTMIFLYLDVLIYKLKIIADLFLFGKFTFNFNILVHTYIYSFLLIRKCIFEFSSIKFYFWQIGNWQKSFFNSTLPLVNYNTRAYKAASNKDTKLGLCIRINYNCKKFYETGQGKKK